MEKRYWRWPGWPSAEEARATESVIQVLRGIAVVWVLLSALISLRHGLAAAENIQLLAAAVAAAGITVVAWLRARTSTRGHAIRLTLVGSALDAALVLAALAAAGIAGERQPWEPLLLLVALGGIRLQLPGAAAGWVLAMAGMVALPGMVGGEPLTSELWVLRAGLAAVMGLLFGLLSTEQRAARAEAEEHLRTVRRTDAWRVRLLGVLAHDLRSPQATTMALAQTLHDRDQQLDTETRRQMSAKIVAQGRRAQRLVDDLLTMAEAEHQGIVIEPELVDLGAAIEKTVAACGVDAVVDVPAGLETRIDTARCAQVLGNLLANAERYGEPPITITARGAPDGGVCIAVSDHGPGVPTEEQDELFDAFTNGGHGGSVGLGLWIVNQVVTAHGGTIDYRDAEPHGATFEIRLPADTSRSLRAAGQDLDGPDGSRSQ